MLHSPTPTQDDRVRHLLDERARRADLAARSSVSEFADSPSLYSPRTVRSRTDSGGRQHPFSSHYFSPSPRSPSCSDTGPTSPHSLYDDNSSYTAPTSRRPYRHGRDDAIYSPGPEDQPQEDADADADADAETSLDSRMSFLGPKMRIHSPAPWEVGEDGFREDDENYVSDSASVTDTLSIFGVKKRARSRTADSTSRKDSLPRPSLESVWSQAKPKKSFETTSSDQTALHALVQASMSSTSLALSTTSSQPSQKVGAKRPVPGLSIPSRKAPDTSPSSPTPTIPPPLPSPSSGIFSLSSSNSSPRGMHAFMSVSDMDLDMRGSTPSPSPIPRNGDFVHPYANPDVVPRGRDSRLLSVHSTIATRGISRSDSIATITRSVAEDVSPDGRELSPSTVTVQPWETPAPGTGTFKMALISLEEARDRARGVSANGIPMDGIAVKDDLSPSPKPVRGRPRSSSFGARSFNRQTVVFADGTSLPAVPILPPAPPVPVRGLTDPPPPSQNPQTNMPPVVVTGKTIKHKKSGLMNKLSLFAGKEGKQGGLHFVAVSPIPPVPPLNPAAHVSMSSDHDAEYGPSNATSQAQTSHSSSSELGSSLRAIKRVPVPALSLGSSGTLGSLRDRPDESAPSAARATPVPPFVGKRPPPLNVVIRSPYLERPGPASARDASSASPSKQQLHGSLATPHRHDDAPRSAPPGQTNFPSLRLRPVSTVFSAHFAGHLIDNGLNGDGTRDSSSTGSDSRTSADVETPSTSTSMDSLLTPISLSSSSNTLAGSTSAKALSNEPGNSAAVIRALQDQISSARKAWQRQIWELEGQVRDLQSEVEDLRATRKHLGACEMCGRSIGESDELHDSRVSVLNRPRAKTSTGSRFGSNR